MKFAQPCMDRREAAARLHSADCNGGNLLLPVIFLLSRTKGESRQDDIDIVKAFLVIFHVFTIVATFMVPQCLLRYTSPFVILCF